LIEQLDRARQPIELKAFGLRVERGALLGGKIRRAPDSPVLISGMTARRCFHDSAAQ